ncbi:MAG: response regulator [Methylotenera sp.]|nr:response regulator [Methylotenera sp.]
MAEVFDIGPLSWVKDEIDLSLKKVRSSFVEVNDKPETYASLRFTIAHLNQVSGALDMVGLEGCKRYCTEIEKLTSKLEKHEIAVSNEIMVHLTQAVDALSQYLQDLLNGQPDTPTRLYHHLKPLVDAQGETLEIGDLFYPDTSNSAPKNLPTNPIAEDAVPIFVGEQRTSFQKSLLDWLRSKDADSLANMRLAISNVQQVPQKSGLKTLWWTATAFTDALAQNLIAEDSGAKKLCRRLDQQLRNMSMGDTKVPSQLLRNVLYYVAISDRSTDDIAKVKDVFELDDLLPAVTKAGGAAESEAERAVLALLHAELPQLKDLWASISRGNYKTDFSAFSEKIDYFNTALQGMSNQNVLKLVNAANATMHVFHADETKVNETAFIEVAASLNLLEHISVNYQQLDVEVQQKISTQTARLQSIMEGVALVDAADAFASVKLDASVIEAVAKQIIGALQLVEKSLDTFFRNPSEVAVLDDATKPLQQISAAFEMLEMPIPKAITQLSTAYVAHFKKHAAETSNRANFEIVAESLSMLGLYAEELPNTRAESEAALEGALQRLEQGAQALGLKVKVSSARTSKIVAETPAKEAGVEAVLAKTSTIVAHKEAPVGDMTDVAIDPELQDIFLIESEEVQATLAQNLQALRVNATDSEALVEVRRAYHTLKGSGNTIGLTGMGAVAWSVEKLLNGIMERKAFPTPAQLAFVEKVSAAFAAWSATLLVDDKVTLNPAPFQQEASVLENDHDAATANLKPQKEEVLIGGTRRLSRVFYNIFMAEAQQHVEALKEAQSALITNAIEASSADSCRAAHTLGSNALTAGFIPIGDLARALTHWLEVHTGAWTEQHIALYGNVVSALEDGLEKARALKNPKSSRALIIALASSTAAMQAAAAEQADAAVNKTQKDAKPSKNVKTEVVVEEVSGTNTLTSVISTPEIVASEMTADEVLMVETTSPIEALGTLHVEEVTSETTQIVIQASAPADTAVNQELLGLFVEEAREIVPQVGRDLRNWRATPEAKEYPDSLQRLLHTLKGSARMAGQANIGDNVHSMEDRVIRALRHKATADDFDEMFTEFDRIGYMLEEITGGVKVVPGVEKVAAAPVPTRAAERKSQFLRMRADVLDRLISEAGEVSIMRSRMDRELQNFKQSSVDLTDSITRMRTYLRELELEAETQMQSRMSLLQEANETFDPLEFDRFTRLQELTRMMAESVNDVATIQGGLLLNLDQTDAALQQQSRMNRELQQGLMGVRMLPFETIVERLQRIVRQTARELNKQVEMTVEGESIEMDRGVLDKLGAPLEHLLRNAVAHGLESTQSRKKIGKSEVGHIKLKVSLENDEITLVVTDDGSGINLKKVKQKAIEKGLLAADQKVSDQALMAIIFEPGFSTAETISQIAGRGVGLDAVRSDIAALSGRIDVSNVVGTGAMFNVYLPVTLSVAQVTMVRVGNKMFAIPSVMVEQVQKLKQIDLANAYEAHKIEWSKREYPLHYLAKLIGDHDRVARHQVYTPLVLLRSGTYRTALHVDEVQGNQEVVMKQMGTQLARVPGMIGATVMGDGQIVLVINPVQLANREELSVGAIKVTTIAPEVEQLKKIALVVDDSLTMRKVLARVLERDGFDVITANDGLDAIQKLQLIKPNIILSDIEMPRMDGFEFSRHVRENEETSHIPLIIISSRTADKHRNFAKEIGVNAFLGKPVQDDELLTQVNALLK